MSVHPKTSSLILAVAAASVLFTLEAQGAIRTWSNTATDFNAATGSWSATLGNTDKAQFATDRVFNPELTASKQISGLIFAVNTTTTTTPTSAGGSYTLSQKSGTGAALTMTSTGTYSGDRMIYQNTTGTNEISAPIILGGTSATNYHSIEVQNGSLILSGNISSNTSGGGIGKLGLGSDTLSNLADITKSQVTLSGDNTFVGGVQLTQNSRLNINSATALGTGTFFLGTTFGCKIDNTSGAAIALTKHNPLNLYGGFQFLGSNSLDLGDGAVTLVATNTNGCAIDVYANTLTIGGGIAGSGSAQRITKGSAGTLILNGTNTYTNITQVSGGKLVVNGSHTGGSGTGTSTASSAYVVSGGATLGGKGMITPASNMNVTVNGGGKLAPGGLATDNSGIGTMTFTFSGTGALNLSAAVSGAGTAALQFDLGATTDKIAVTSGGVTITNGTLAFDDFAFTALSGLQSGKYTLIDTNNVLTTAALASTGLSGQIGTGTGTGALSVENGDLMLMVTVPEPATASIVAGMLSLGLLRRSRRK